MEKQTRFRTVIEPKMRLSTDTRSRKKMFLGILIAAVLMAAGCSGKNTGNSEAADSGSPNTEASAETTAAAPEELSGGLTADASAEGNAESDPAQGNPADESGEFSSDEMPAAEDGDSPAPDSAAEDGDPLPPEVTEDGTIRIWNESDAVSAEIPIPDGFYLDEEISDRSHIALRSSDTDSLNAEVFYSIYEPADHMSDDAMIDMLEMEVAERQLEADTTADDPGEIQVISTPAGELHAASLQVTYAPSDGAPLYTNEYLIWRTRDDGTLISCHVNLYSANPQPVFSETEAGEIYLLSVE